MFGLDSTVCPPVCIMSAYILLFGDESAEFGPSTNGQRRLERLQLSCYEFLHHFGLGEMHVDGLVDGGLMVRFRFHLGPIGRSVAIPRLLRQGFLLLQCHGQVQELHRHPCGLIRTQEEIGRLFTGTLDPNLAALQPKL